MRLHEEHLSIDKEQKQTGKVNVEKHIVETQERVEVPVEHEEVYIERRAVDETAAGDIVDDGEKIHILVMEERVEVTKRPVVSEEIVVGKRKVTDTELVNETVRREKADIQRTEDDVANYNESKTLDNDPLEENRLENDSLNKRCRL